jgi:hypothetical protein
VAHVWHSCRVKFEVFSLPVFKKSFEKNKTSNKVFFRQVFPSNEISHTALSAEQGRNMVLIIICGIKYTFEMEERKILT